ncbi:hypothetical protein Tco_0831342 [Tanacetum coccineum]
MDDEFNTSPDLSSSDDAKKEIKLEDLSKLVQNVKVNFKDLDSPEHDAPIIIQDEDVEEAYIEEFHDEEVHDKQHTTPKDTSASHPPSLKTIRIQEPSTQVHLLQTLNSKLVYEKEVVETKAALLKAKPSFTNVEQLIELLVSSAQAKIKTLDALPSLLKKVTEPLNMFAHAIKAYQDKGKEAMSYKENKEEESEIDSEPTVKLTGSMVKSSKTKKLNKFDFVTKKGDHIHLTEEQIKEQKRIEESIKADMAKREEEVGKEELVDLLGIDVVSDLHLSGWREVMQAYPKRTRAGWTTIYEQTLTRMGNLHKTEQELEIDFKKPLGEYDPLDKLNDLARKKRKHANDIHDYFRSTKRYKSSVQYEDHPFGNVLNEPCLGMIKFNSHQRRDFVTIEDFGGLTNEILYTVQEIFFRLHQGPGQDDNAMTFSSFLLAEVDKRNLNPLKQMRSIE